MKRFTIIVLFLFLGMQLVFAQGKRISGVVTSSEDGSTLPGVTILIKGTANGVTTDLNGEYELTVAETSTLVFSFIGYDPQEIAINGRSVINVVIMVGLEQLVVAIFTSIPSLYSPEI